MSPSGDDWWKTGKYIEWYVNDPLVEKNTFLKRKASPFSVPSFEAAKAKLPHPHWPANELAIAAYWKAWELAWKNLRVPAPGSGFVSPYIDTAFNDCLFMWDSAFIVQFGRYGSRAFPFQGTLDNLYAHQHPDGFICREIRVADGTDQWNRASAMATGPNVLAWAEWNYYENFGDRDRLREVYSPLCAYHRWTRKNRTWKDGGYWTTGLACGMDNMPRVPKGVDSEMEHGWMTWVDATCHALLSARLLLKMGHELGQPDSLGLAQEIANLTQIIQTQLWSAETGFFHDCDRLGQPLKSKSVAAFWALLAGAASGEQVESLARHLADEKSFNRPHRVPSLAADAPGYDGDDGGYWCGAVWAPTTYMVLRGLSEVKRDALAFEIARNHHSNMVKVFQDTGTLWENYSPEKARPGKPAKADFVGWSGLPPIAVLLEYVFGLRPLDARAGKLLWDVRLTDEHGVDDYPLGTSATLSLCCSSRRRETDEPDVTVRANQPVEVLVRWPGGEKAVRSRPA